MNSILKCLRFVFIVLLIFLAGIGIGLAGPIPIPKVTSRVKEDSKIELIEDKEEEEEAEIK